MRGHSLVIFILNFRVMKRAIIISLSFFIFSISPAQNTQLRTKNGTNLSTAGQERNIYSYRDNKANDYRFFNKRKYRILENGVITIYLFLLPGDKQTGFRPIPEYYFSRGLNDNIRKLTIRNLKDTFREDDYWLDLIDMNFRFDEDLLQYDEYHSMYRVNHVLSHRYW